jgi:hypothetical protein
MQPTIISQEECANESKYFLKTGSPDEFNCALSILSIGSQPRAFIFASRDIKKDELLTLHTKHKKIPKIVGFSENCEIPFFQNEGNEGSFISFRH